MAARKKKEREEAERQRRQQEEEEEELLRDQEQEELSRTASRVLASSQATADQGRGEDKLGEEAVVEECASSAAEWDNAAVAENKEEAVLDLWSV